MMLVEFDKFISVSLWSDVTPFYNPNVFDVEVC